MHRVTYRRILSTIETEGNLLNTVRRNKFVNADIGQFTLTRTIWFEKTVIKDQTLKCKLYFPIILYYKYDLT